MGNFFSAIWSGIKGIFNFISGNSTALANGASLAYQISKDKHLTGAEREANEFSANQAAENRFFQSQEAEKARQWQEEQYLKYNSPSALVSQYQDAGLNPALMFGGQTPAASTSTAAPSGDMASSVAPSGGDVLGALMALFKTKYEVENLKEEARSKYFESRLKEADLDSRAILNEETINNLRANTSAALESGKLSKFNRTILGPLDFAIKKVEKEKKEYETTTAYVTALYDQWRKEYYDEHHSWPSDKAQNAFILWIEGALHELKKNSPFEYNGDKIMFPLN